MTIEETIKLAGCIGEPDETFVKTIKEYQSKGFKIRSLHADYAYMKNSETDICVDIFLVYGKVTAEEYDRTGKTILRKEDIDKQFSIDYMGG